MSYIISLPDKATWNIDDIILAEELNDHWPGINVRRISDPQDVRTIIWGMDMAAGYLDGARLREVDMICLYSDIDNCAEFAVWFRTLIPKKYPLLFHDHGHVVDVDLQHTTTIEDIQNAFLDLWQE